ncbi:hypothetical protein HAP94_19920 [Acidithiobacillus ferrivorans]|nr:hypothetical protein [Acidithiobacillus ferrivorans]
MNDATTTTLADLERRLTDLESKATGLGLDAQIGNLLRKIYRNNPTYHLETASFFMEYAAVQNNIKQMGYYIGQQQMDKYGIAGVSGN